MALSVPQRMALRHGDLEFEKEVLETEIIHHEEQTSIIPIHNTGQFMQQDQPVKQWIE
ncbi:hypothetical protein KX928_00765 [Roseobacter sp. YSTF-M11]|uniref:Uncharacterized protein n=1 Tax=Roseobacter insulae TaxID=2859783 RepID=A0A9X1FR84_9RHOB|nr:hypothetical protein [Roseobacter insulae]MBW4706311.1 hypothetical protein [Roseobacter insulae]